MRRAARMIMAGSFFVPALWAGAEASLIPPSPGHVRVTVELLFGHERVNRTGETSITLTAETP